METLETLLNACSDGDESQIFNLLQKGISVNAQNAEGETPLQIASANGCIDIIHFLLQQGAFVDLPNNYGWTPLMLATFYGYAEIVALLLSRRAKVNMFNKLGFTAVDFAAWNGDLPILKLLIEAGGVVGEAPTSRNNEWNFSSLMAAAIQGHSEIFRFLLERGCTINYTSPETGMTPLMLAACNGHQLLLRMIVEHGGNINKVNICGKSALDMAIECNQSEIEAYLDSISSRNSGSSASNGILQAIRNGDFLKVASIIQQDPATVNICDSFDGTTPLMLAATLGYNDIVEALIDSGTDLDVQDLNKGWTALMYAVFHRNAETVKMLIENGARVDLFSFIGYTAIDLATYIGSSDSDVFQILSTSCEGVNSIQRFSYSSMLNESGQGFLSPEENQISVSPQRSPSHSRSKEQSVNEPQSLQLKAPMCSSNFLAVSPIATSAESNDESDEKFSDLNSSCEDLENVTLNAFEFLPPDKYLASVFQDHEVGTIRPDFLSCHMDDVSAIPSRKESCDDINKPPMNSLNTPHLVKLLMERRHKQFGATNALPLDDSLLEFDDSTSNQEDLVLKSHGSTLSFDGSALKQEDLALEYHGSALSLGVSTSNQEDLGLKSHSSTHSLDDSTSKSGEFDDSTLKFDDLTLKLNNLTLKLENDLLKSYDSSLKSSDTTLKSASNLQALSDSNRLEADSNTIVFEKGPTEKVPELEIEKGADSGNAGDLTMLLNKESLQKYVQKFRDQEIDLESFLCLTEDDFKNIGIEARESRQKFLDIISKIRNT